MNVKFHYSQDGILKEGEEEEGRGSKRHLSINEGTHLITGIINNNNNWADDSAS